MGCSKHVQEDLCPSVYTQAVLPLQLHAGFVEQTGQISTCVIIPPALLQQVSMYEHSQNVSWSAAKLPCDGMVVCTLVEQPVVNPFVVMVQMKARISPVHPAVDWLYLCMAATAAVETACLQSSSALIWTTELHNQVCCGWPFAFTPWPSASCICLSLRFLPLCLRTIGILHLRDMSHGVMTNQLSGRQYEI